MMTKKWKQQLYSIDEWIFKMYLCIQLEKEMATHSSVLAWRIPGTGEPGGLPSMGLHRVGDDWSDLAAAMLVGFEELFPLFCQVVVRVHYVFLSFRCCRVYNKINSFTHDANNFYLFMFLLCQSCKWFLNFIDFCSSFFFSCECLW